jgi:endonuclease/exonuclease/phosphatase family metal-dependent hydrolase
MAESNNVKILQLNIWMGRLARGLVRYVSDTNADVICLQEVFSGPADIAFPDNTFNILELIQEASGLEYVFFAPISSVTIGDQKAYMGNAILSRYPISDEQSFFTNGKYVENLSTSNRIANTRGAQSCTVTLPNNKKLSIVNHHAHWEKSPLGSQTSVEKMQLVADHIRTLHHPIIFCGDLNLSPESPAMRIFDDWLTDHISLTDAKTTLSGLNVPFDVICDHILTNNQISVDYIRADDKVLVSDHLPVIATCRL